MKKRYSLLLVLSGVGWFLIAGVLGTAVPVFGNLWIQHSICAMITAFVVGIAFRGAIRHWSGWRWYFLPFLTLLVATATFGFLLPCTWFVTQLFRGGGVNSEAFYKTPLAMVFYSMTVYLVILYPGALLTQHLLRRGMAWHDRTKNVDAIPTT
jgi:hypothetical protein